MTLQELLQNRGEIVDKMKKLLNSAEAEGRDLNEEEQSSYNQMDSDQESLKNRADRMQKQASLEGGFGLGPDNPVAPVIEQSAQNRYGAEYGAAFYSALRTGKATALPEVLNALQVGTDSEGGFVTPESFETALVKALLNVNDIRKYATVLKTSSDRNIPIEETKGSSTWLAEEAAYSESDNAFGRVVLGSHKLGRIIKVSEELLQDSFFDLESYLAESFGESHGVSEEIAFINGDGSGKPSGIVPGATVGVNASGASAIAADELMDLYYSLKRQYRKNAVFLVNDLTVKLIRKLKDSDGQYIWQMGLKAGEPDTLLGRPLIDSDAVPEATTGNRSVAFGDLKYYRIADRRGSTIQRLNELYAANGQVGFRGYKRTEGKLVLPDAIKCLVQA